jgi:VanZ family protein
MPRIAWWMTITYWVALFAATHIPAYKLPRVSVNDKTIHTVCYGLLAIALMISLHLRGRLNAGTGITVLAILLAYGAIDEWSQIPVGRSCELADWYADAAGAGVGVVMVTLLLRRGGWRMEDRG